MHVFHYQVVIYRILFRESLNAVFFFYWNFTCRLADKCAPIRLKNRMTHPPMVSWKLHDPPLTKGAKTNDPPPLCSGPPHPILFDQSINNGNWTEWSAIWSEIIRLISKSNERAARVWFEITSMISDQNCTTQSSITTLLHIFWNHSFIVNVNILFLLLHFHFDGIKIRMRFRAKNGAIWE